MNKQQWQAELDKHAAAAKAKGWCEQCQHPWYDGECTCGHFDDPEVEAALELASLGGRWLNEPTTPEPTPSKRKEKIIRPEVPCGESMLDAEYCKEGHLCPSCAYILHLEEKMGIKPAKPAKTMKKLEAIWEGVE
jgi:hypothetical protein